MKFIFIDSWMLDIMLQYLSFCIFRAYAAYEQGIEVDPTLEHEDRKRLEEYTSRLSISGEVIEDPLEIVC